MNGETFEGQVNKIWSTHFGCAPEDLQRAGTTLVSRDKLAGSGAIHIARLRAHAFIEIDPALETELTGLLHRLGHEASLTAANLSESLLAGRVRTADRGFIFHLEADRLLVRTPAPPISIRALTGADQPALQSLFGRCEPGEVDDAYVDVGHEVACGCFVGERMVACGSGYRRHGFMDLGVLTDPAFRGRRLAPAIVSDLARRAIDLAAVSMYRCDQTNTASRRVAEMAGFTRCFITETLTLAPA
jgi:hypothetical protein